MAAQTYIDLESASYVSPDDDNATNVKTDTIILPSYRYSVRFCCSYITRP